MKNTKLLAVLVTFTLSSCAFLEGKKLDPEISYLQGAPKVTMEKFFEGNLESFAIVQDANGKIIQSYTSEIEGEWEENKGIVKKKYTYNDGKKDSRTWLITDNKDGTFDAVGHDMAESARGKQVGNAVQMLYALYVKENGIKTKVRFEDDYYLVDDTSMISTSIARSTSGDVISKSIVSLKKVKPENNVKINKVKRSIALPRSEPEVLDAVNEIAD